MHDIRRPSLLVMVLILLSQGQRVFSQDPIPSSLEIANPNPVGSGARALGQGNTFIAIADDATAATWNPGGLPQLQRPEISLAGESISQWERTNLNPTADDSLDLHTLNFASLVLPFYYKTPIIFSLNYLRLFRFDRDLNLPFEVGADTAGSPPDFFGTYEFDQDGAFSVVAPSFAVQVTSKLMVGITVNIWNDSITQSSAFEKTEQTVAFENQPGSPEPIPLPPLLEFNRFEVDEGYSLVFGGIYRFSKAWTIGGVIKPAYRLNLDHEQSVSVIQNGQQNRLPDFDINTDADLEFPWILGFGAAWRPTDPLTISSDITWTNWSEYRFQESGRDQNPIDATSAKLTDTFTLRLGGEYLLLFDHIALLSRWGAGYDPAPAIGDSDDFYTVNVGAGVQIHNRVSFDLAYEFRWGDRVNGDALRGFSTSQDVRRHRILASMICYF